MDLSLVKLKTRGPWTSGGETRTGPIAERLMSMQGEPRPTHGAFEAKKAAEMSWRRKVGWIAPSGSLTFRSTRTQPQAARFFRPGNSSSRSLPIVSAYGWSG